jgi:hypothetical protein
MMPEEPAMGISVEQMAGLACVPALATISHSMQPFKTRNTTASFDL